MASYRDNFTFHSFTTQIQVESVTTCAKPPQRDEAGSRCYVKVTNPDHSFLLHLMLQHSTAKQIVRIYIVWEITPLSRAVVATWFVLVSCLACF
jgi:hypothetical protein